MPITGALDFTWTLTRNVNGIGKMARKITNPKEGVSVKIDGKNAVKVLKVIGKTHRTFASEVNVAVEEKMDERISEYKDNGK